MCPSEETSGPCFLYKQEDLKYLWRDDIIQEAGMR